MADDEYLNSILKWREEMDANLRRENDWLAAAGLFWLKERLQYIRLFARLRHPFPKTDAAFAGRVRV